MGRQCCCDLRGNVYPDVPVDDTVCTAVCMASCQGSEETEIRTALSDPCWGHGISWISDPVFLYGISFFPGCGILCIPAFTKKDPGAVILWCSLCSGLRTCCAVLSGKYVPYFPGLPGNRGHG